MDICTAQQHGDLNAYNHHGCRCPAAQQARMRQEKRHNLRVNTLGHGLWINPVGTTRRLRALTTLGWTTRQLAHQLGTYQVQVRRLIAGNTRVHVDTATRVKDLYERLSMTPGPSQRTRNWANRQGWAPPLAWDDPDDPDEQPRGIRAPQRPQADDIDWAVVEQLCAGTHQNRPTRAERHEAIQRLREYGYPTALIAQRIRRNPRQIERDLHDLGLTQKHPQLVVSTGDVPAGQSHNPVDDFASAALIADPQRTTTEDAA